MLLIVGLLSSHVSFAQDPPVFSQFLANPYQFNPAYAAHNGYAEANVFYRKQWLGFDNAPEALSFNVHTPLGRNVAIGLLAYSSKTILLNTSAALATFGYKVRLGSFSSLNFGLSAGMGFNSFKLDAVSGSNDPALRNIIPKTNALNSQFGINLNIRKFNFGIALPELLDSKITHSSEGMKRFSPFAGKFAAMSYEFNLRDISVTPAIIYRALDNVQFQWEGLVMATWRNTISLGTSYRDGYGVTFTIGFGINKLRIGYNYEHPTGGIAKAPNSGTHEFHAGLRLGNYNREEAILARHDADSTTGDGGAYANYEVGGSSKEEIAEGDSNLSDSDPEQLAHVNSRHASTAIDDDADGYVLKGIGASNINVSRNDPATLTTVADRNSNAGHYVVLGVYREQNNALRQMGYLKERGYAPALLYVPEKRYYYVYILHSTSRQDAVQERKRVRRNNQFFGAWIFSIE